MSLRRASKEWQGFFPRNASRLQKWYALAEQGQSEASTSRPALKPSAERAANGLWTL